jgi:hypothetical protein
MANPTFEEGSLARRKKPGEDLTGKDTFLPTSSYGIHKTTPPTLADGDVAHQQMDDMGNIKVSLGDPAQLAELGGGMLIPRHNQQVIDESDPNDVTITYKLDSTTVATKEIVVSGTTTTITMTVV